MTRKLVIILFVLTAGFFIQQLSFSNAPMVVDPKIQTLITQSMAAESKNDLVAAININKQILEIESSNVYALNAIAGLYGKLGHYEDELTWAKKAMDIDSGYELAYINYGNALFKMGRSAEAKSAYLNAADINPKSAVAEYSLGLIADADDDYAGAIEYYKKSITLDPRFTDGYFNLAADYANLKNFDQAIVELKRLLEIDPTAQDAKDMLAAIENNR